MHGTMISDLINISGDVHHISPKAYLKNNDKGGVVIGISDQFKIPVKYIGLGEGMEDLQVFRKNEFVDSLFGENA